MNKLEKIGKIIVHELLLTPSIREGENSSSSDLSWEQLVQQLPCAGNQVGVHDSSNQSDAVKKHLLFVDDLEAFELIAPSPAAARQYLARVISALHYAASASTRGDSNSSKSSWVGLVAYGRHPLQLVPRLLSLGDSIYNGESVGGAINTFGSSLVVNSINSNARTASLQANILSHHMPLQSTTNGGEPALSEYLRYR